MFIFFHEIQRSPLRRKLQERNFLVGHVILTFMVQLVWHAKVHKKVQFEHMFSHNAQVRDRLSALSWKNEHFACDHT